MRVSVTNVDALEYALAADLGRDEILARLRHRVEPTEAMRAGRAFHEILEHPPAATLATVEHEGHRFEFQSDAELALPAIREIKAEVPVRVDGINVTLVGKIDALQGTRIDDHKLTGQFAAERYTEAFQWRAYLWLFGAERFRYNVFTAGRLKDGTWRIRACDSLEFCRYPGLAADVRRRLVDYVAFCQRHMPAPHHLGGTFDGIQGKKTS